MNTNISELLKETRKQNNLTQKSLAEKSGISFVTINRIEKGIEPRITVAKKLFYSMGYDLNFLLMAQVVTENTIEQNELG